MYNVNGKQESQVNRWEWRTFSVDEDLLLVDVPRLQVRYLVESLTGVQTLGQSFPSDQCSRCAQQMPTGLSQL